jgi:hypothetical protein
MKIGRTWIIVPWALFVLAALGWVFYWHFVANEAERTVRGWAFEQNAGGATVEIDRIVRHGFPVLMRLELQNMSYAAARGGWRAETERADVHVNLWNPQHVTVESKAPISIARASGATTNITADALIASLRTRGNALAEAGIEADNLVLDDPAEEGVLHATKVVAQCAASKRSGSMWRCCVRRS